MRAKTADASQWKPGTYILFINESLMILNLPPGLHVECAPLNELEPYLVHDGSLEAIQ